MQIHNERYSALTAVQDDGSEHANSANIDCAIKLIDAPSYR